MIPEELKRLDRWVCALNGTKAPMMAFEFRGARVSDPETWSDYECAAQSVTNGVYDNVGFVFADDGYVGIDLDRGFDEDGFITAEAAEIINRFDSYTEVSRSGRGFHIIVKGALPFAGRNNGQGMEIYRSGRYFILTGNTLKDSIREGQAAIDWMVESYFPEPVRTVTDRPFRPRQYSPVWKWRREGRRIPLNPYYPPVPEGGRNVALLSMGGSLREAGYAKRQVYDILMRVNREACDPPLNPYEVRSITESVMRYK